MAVRAGRLGAIYANTAGTEGYVHQAATTCLNPGTYTRYQVTESSKQYFKPTQGYTCSELQSFTYSTLENYCYAELEVVAVWVNGTLQTSGYSIEYPGGVVVFDSALGASDVVTVSARYWDMAQVGGFFDWSMDKAMSVEDAPQFGSGWRSRVAILKDVNVTATKFWVNNGYFEDPANMDSLLLVVLYVDTSAGYRYEGYARVEGISPGVPHDELVRQRIIFRSYGAWYYREG